MDNLIWINFSFFLLNRIKIDVVGRLTFDRTQIIFVHIVSKLVNFIVPFAVFRQRIQNT